MKFTHLHVHSHYSLLDGLAKIDLLLDACQELKMPSIALTDHGSMYGLVEFFQKAKKRGIRPIMGCEMYIAPNGMHQKRPNIDAKNHHLVLLIKNKVGYRNLVKLNTKAHLEGFYYKPRIDKDLLREYSEGLIGMSACLAGEIPKAIVSNDLEKAEELALEYKEIFGKDDFYLEIQHHPGFPEQKPVNEALIKIGRKHNIPLVATNDTHYVKKEDAEAQDVLMSVQTDKRISDQNRLTMTIDDFSLRSIEEMIKDFKDTPDAIENTQKIVEKCNFEFELGKYQLPYFEVPKGQTPDKFLKNLCKKGLKKRYSNIDKEITERLDYELNVIKETGFASYFLIVQDFINWAKSKDIVCGPGRGCFLPDTKILLKDGCQKSIQKIRPNERIISALGNKRKVKKILNYDVDEEIAIIKSKMPAFDLKLTKDHKVLAVKHDMCPIKPTKATICKPTCNISCRKNLYKNYKLQWIKAENLKKNDFLVYPIVKHRQIKNIKFDLLKFNNLDTHLKGNNKYVWYEIGTNKLIQKKIKRYIKLDKKFAQLLGFYIAEGWSRTRRKLREATIGFGFHKDEKEYIEKVRELLKQIFELESTVTLHKTRNSRQVHAYSRIVGKFFERLCGQYSQNKHIPYQIFESSDEIVISLLTSLFKGDGSNKELMRISFDSTSLNLVSQIKMLLGRLGIMSSIKTRKYKNQAWHQSYKLTISGKQLFKFNQLFKKFQIPIKKQNFYRNDTFIWRNYIWFPVKEVLFKKYKGKVYDLTVEKDASYVANNITVHNSAAGSIIAYLLGITDVDPLKYDLLFERFLNPQRISLPDIDLDFADARRDEVIEYVSKKYGKDHVAQIITFGTMAARAAIRDVGRVLDYPYIFCDQIAKMIPFGSSLEKAIHESPELHQKYESDEDTKKLINMAMKLEGVIRHASTHACGVVITKEPLYNLVPCQRPTQGDQSIVTQYEMHAIEDLGLLKMDFLGLKTLTVIQNTLNQIKEFTKKEINLSKLPLDDKKTFELFQQTNTTGVFQLECLSEKTIISNTTIKKLYERKNKKSLRSIYLDKGTVHKNKILDVLPSGKKNIYTLIVDNGWYIKASSDHHFLTENGWKQLKDIKKDERILIKKKAKHLIYNTCKICNKQINGQKEGKSNYCYKCSATFYKNPSKSKSRKKISESIKQFYMNGGKPWNYNQTKENNKILLKTGRKISKSLTGRSYEDLYGPVKAKQLKKYFSRKFSGSGNPMFGKKAPHRKGGYRKDLKHYVRSNWEADFARILKLYNIKYEYEPKTFKLKSKNEEIFHYTPDFYVKSSNTFYEIKGWLHKLDEKKMKLFQEQYPQYNFTLINATKFAELALQYKNLIKWECPRIPTEKSFEFIKVKEIKYSGKEMTYDIVMKSPGNNFIANGFVVHNSGGMKRNLKELKPSKFEDIIAMVALYRPGPMEFIPEFIACKHGLKEVKYLHPKLKPILENTYGIMVYQEQLMRIARDLAGFSLSEADVLRKAVGKKIKKLLDEQKEKMIEGMINNEISSQIAKRIWETIEPFAQYGFNKSHSTCYALIGYQTAYLKAHYPTEFMAALITSEQNDIERIAFLIDDCKKMDIQILPPDINKSFQNFTKVGEKTISFGLRAIKNVGHNVVQSIIEERIKNGEFKSISDFIERVKSKDLNKKSLESLIKCGALDNFGERNQLLGALEQMLSLAREIQKAKQDGQISLFGNQSPVAIPVFKLPEVAPTNKKERLSWEKELLGLYVSEHPLHNYKNYLMKKVSLCNAISKDQAGHKVKIGGVISRIKRINTKTGQPMLFVEIEDTTGHMEAIVFPNILEKTADTWQEERIVLVSGRLSDRDGNLKILCDRVKVLE